MIQHELAGMVTKAINKAQKKGDLPPFEIPEVTIEHPKQADHGDMASPVCMQMARLARMAPMQIAEKVVKYLPQAEFLGQVTVAHPGFINFTLQPAWLARQVDAILSQPDAFGNIDLGKGKQVQVEFVSANPTGPLTVGSGRNAVLGDALANVLSAAGYSVQREYYVNDAGTQMGHFANTTYVRYAQALGRDETLPEQGYQGYYMIELGRDIAAAEGDRFLQMDREDATRVLGEIGLEMMLEAHPRRLGLHGHRVRPVVLGA